MDDRRSLKGKLVTGKHIRLSRIAQAMSVGFGKVHFLLRVSTPEQKCIGGPEQ